MIEKSHIINEIQRTANENGGSPLGRLRFLTATGIKESDWSGRYWSRWADALREAGFEPNKLQARHTDDFVLASLAKYVRELGHFPVSAELKLRKREDSSFPASKVFERFGGKTGLVSALRSYCERVTEYEDVKALCQETGDGAGVPIASREDAQATEFGEVYLLKSGKHYKIGRTNAVGRRARELAIQLPEKATLVHAIKTDDPIGIEAYWHTRFANQRKNGEWFALSTEDVSAFRRRKFM